MFLLSTLCHAAEHSNFYFSRAYDEIIAAKNIDEIFAKLKLMNVDSTFFEISKSVLEPETVKEYVAVQERINRYNEASKHFDNLEMKQFSLHLIASLETHLDLFSEIRIIDALGLIYATIELHVDVLERVKEILRKLIPNLSIVGRYLLYNTFLKYASIDSNCYLVCMMVEPDYLDAETVQVFVTEYIEKVCRNLPQNLRKIHLSTMVTYLHVLSTTDIGFAERSYELLLLGIKAAIHHNFKGITPKLLQACNDLLINVECTQQIFHHVTDLIFNEHVLKFVDMAKLQGDFVDVTTKCALADKAYFKSILDTVDGIEIYKNCYKQYSTVSMCISAIEALTEESSEAQFKFALSSAKNLLKIQKAGQLNFSIILDFFKGISSFFYSLKSVTDTHFDSHPQQVICLQMVAYLAITYVRIIENDVPYWISHHLAKSVGQLISKLNSTEKYASDLVDESRPIIDVVLIGLRSRAHDSKKKMTAIELGALFNFVRLHPSPAVVQDTTDKLCFDMIISMPIHEKGYAYVKDLDFTSELQIATTAFNYFLQMHTDNENVGAFEDYFNHLVKQKFLSKTEQLAIRRIFNDFN